jgi:Zn-finger nucleic acid-binding protein
MTERLNIEIDYCPQCRGVWLDRGELDKIIERSVRDMTPAATAQSQPSAQNQPSAYIPPPQPQYDHDGGHRERHHDGHDNYRGKKSIWKELFD